MERWATVKRLHQAALERTVNQRAAFLDEACAGDESLRQEVESLLTYEADADAFMESPAVEVTARDIGETPSMPLVGRTLGPYQVQSLLGAGGMGEVYLAADRRLDRAVALKILPYDLTGDVDRLQRFMREAKAASALNHPNVATIHDIGQSDDVHFIVMEYVDGKTLAEEMATQPVAAADIVEIAIQVADALDAAHAKGITHRDIKPANLMRTARGQVKVLDFGIAKIAGPPTGPPQGGHDVHDRRSVRLQPDQALTASASHATRAGMVLGSAPYMSPEQVLGRDVDHRSDLFSVGVTLYELATRRLPFFGATPLETMSQIVHAEPEPIARFNDVIPETFERITSKCLAKDVGRRYQSARELLADLRQLQQATDRARIPLGEHRRHNLPAQLTSFVGRQRDIDEIRRLLATSRLLTLSGAGGCGKTRLALQVASGLLDQFADGVWVVDLSPLSEQGLIPQTVAATLGAREAPNRSLVDVLVEYCHSRHLLLVLDNCEHLIGACAQLVEAMLRAAPNLHVLATSREALGITGEVVSRVPSLALPTASELPAAEALLQYDAIRLFAERARAVDASFTVSASNAATVAEICRRLDGIPLAIELAAARLNVLSMDQINVRLNDRFRLLTGGSRTAVARQRTLEATIDWSYDLLSEAERSLLCRLSVFPGGWTLEAAEEVCAGNGIDRENMLDLLSHVVDKSLVNVEDDVSGNRRYRCLETVRQYGRERLIRSGDVERVRDLHLKFFFSLVQRAEPELIKADQAGWLTRMQIEYDNLRSALEWCLDSHSEEETGLEMAAALSWFWVKRCYYREGRQWLERALAATRGASLVLQAKALNFVSLIVFFQGDHATALRLLEKGLALGSEAGDQAEIAWSLGLQSIVVLEIGDMGRSARLATESRNAAIASGELWRQGPALFSLAHEALHAGDHDRAWACAQEAVALFRRTGDKWALLNHLEDLAGLGILVGDYAQTEAVCAEALLLSQEVGERMMTGVFLGILADAQAAQDRPQRAARLWGAMHGLFEGVGIRQQDMVRVFGMFGNRFRDRAEASVGDEAFHEALSEGRAMSLTQAVEYALAEMGASSTAATN